jgi:pimeloyl-ACP methyl ester carboxylesterase
MKVARNTITIDNLRVRYYQLGTGMPLLFLHGGRVRALTFKRSLEELSKHYTVIAPDIPGYGASGTPKDIWSYKDYAVFFEGFLEKLGLNDITLAGYSMGGGIAFNLAAINSRVNRLVLIDASGLHPISAKPNSHDLRRLLFYLKHPSYYAILIALTREYVKFIWKHRDDYWYIQAIRRSCRVTSYEDALRHVTVPTLLLWGRDDWIIPATNATEFQTYMPQAVIKTVEGNHDWPLYKPELLVKKISDWTETT